MAQFDVFRNPNEESREVIPYFLDVQAEIFEPLATRLVIPLVKKSAEMRLFGRLNPETTIEGEKFFLSIPELAGVPLCSLCEKVDNLTHLREEIVAGIDFLITGS
jgi:toxin CcdB